MTGFEPSAMIGEVLGGYRIDALLGRGGMGAVFAVTHLILGRPAAMKVLSSTFASDRSFVGRFLREARVVNAIRHPNIIDIYDVIETPDPPRLALVMERINGLTLRRVLAGGPLLPETVRELMDQLIDALTAIHAVGVVHRDLKPDNIMLLGSGNGALIRPVSIKVLDFGVAKMDDDDPALTTVSGAMIGTPAYMAPEQINAGRGTPAADVYAIGELLYEMVTGERLFRGEARTILRNKLLGNMPPIELANPALETIIRRCVAPEPEDRPALEEIGRALIEVEPRAPSRAQSFAPRPTDPPGEEAALRSVELVLTPFEQSTERRWWIPVLIALATILVVLGLWVARRPSVEPLPLAVEPVTQAPLLSSTKSPTVAIAAAAPTPAPPAKVLAPPSADPPPAPRVTAALEKPRAPAPRPRAKRAQGPAGLTRTATPTPISKDELPTW